MKFKKCPKCGGSGQVADAQSQGAEMRQLRLKACMSQTSVAALMGFTKMYLSDLELGKRSWNPRLLSRFMAALKTNNKGKIHGKTN